MVPTCTLAFKSLTYIVELSGRKVLHIIFIIPMIVNDVNLSVVFRGVNGPSSCRKKRELFLGKEVAFSFVKILLKRMFAGCYIGRV
jgi:hypothetical protein